MMPCAFQLRGLSWCCLLAECVWGLGGVVREIPGKLIAFVNRGYFPPLGT